MTENHEDALGQPLRQFLAHYEGWCEAYEEAHDLAMLPATPLTVERLREAQRRLDPAPSPVRVFEVSQSVRQLLVGQPPPRTVFCRVVPFKIVEDDGRSAHSKFPWPYNEKGFANLDYIKEVQWYDARDTRDGWWQEARLRQGMRGFPPSSETVRLTGTLERLDAFYRENLLFQTLAQTTRFPVYSIPVEEVICQNNTITNPRMGDWLEFPDPPLVIQPGDIPDTTEGS